MWCRVSQKAADQSRVESIRGGLDKRVDLIQPLAQPLETPAAQQSKCGTLEGDHHDHRGKVKERWISERLLKELVYGLSERIQT